MKTRLIGLVLAGIVMAGSFCNAQNRKNKDIQVKMVEADSLVSFIRKNIGTKVFIVSGDTDKNTMSIKAPREQFLEKALTELKDRGYTVTEYNGSLFITRSKNLSQELPTGYFDGGQTLSNEELLRSIEDQNAMVTFQNKVYEIGEKSAAKKSGKAYVSGYVRDIATGEPLTGVAVYDEKSSAYAMTDAYGYYRIQFPVGEGVMCFSGYSMEDLHLNVIVYNEGGLDVVMKEKVTSLKGAVVSSEARSAHRSARMGVEKIRAAEIAKVPAVFGEPDVLKVVLTLPGVKTVGEAATGFNVRGGSVDQNLILFNDGTIFNPSHMFGILSAFNADVISEVELYKSSIPAEFGGRISSVLDVRAKDGNANKVTGSVGLGLLTSRLNLEGPIGKKTTFILGGRTTYSNWILNLLPANSGYAGGKASFNDINIGLCHKFNDRNALHAYGYYSRDGFSFSGDTTFRYSNFNASLKWRSVFTDRLSMVLVAGVDHYDNSLDNYVNDWEAYTLDTQMEQAFAKATFKVSGAKNTLQFGGEAIMMNLLPGSMSPYGELSLVQTRSLNTQEALTPAVFISDTWSPTRWFSIEAGVRGVAFISKTNNARYMAPEYRVSGKISLGENFSIKSGYNTMNQYIHLISNSTSISPMDTWTLCSDRIKPQQGWQAASGLYWTIGKVDLSLEGYYKEMVNYLDYKSGAVLVMNENLADDLVTTRGKSYGAEVMLKKPSGKLNGWVSYTYSRALLQEMEDRGINTINGGAWYCAPHDKPHDVKLVANYKFTHRFSISANCDYSTGRPVTIPIGTYTYGGGNRLAYSDRNGYRIPDYFRLDLGLNIEPSHYLKKLTHMSMTLGCYNVTGRKNAYSVFYSTNGGYIVNGYMISVFATQIPYINLNLKF